MDYRNIKHPGSGRKNAPLSCQLVVRRAAKKAIQRRLKERERKETPAHKTAPP
jgi:hypothetical protein